MALKLDFTLLLLFFGEAMITKKSVNAIYNTLLVLINKVINVINKVINV